MNPVLSVLLATAHLASFAPRAAPSLHALRSCVSAAASSHDPAALLPLLTLLRTVATAPTTRLSYPDSKDLCAALLATLPGATADAFGCADSTHIFTEDATAGAHVPQADALECSFHALATVTALLSRRDVLSQPWCAVRADALLRVAACCRCLTPASCCTSVTIEDAYVAEGRPRTLLGLAAQLCCAIASAHEAELRAVHAQSGAAAASGSSHHMNELLSVLQGCALCAIAPTAAAAAIDKAAPASSQRGARFEPQYIGMSATFTNEDDGIAQAVVSDIAHIWTAMALALKLACTHSSQAAHSHNANSGATFVQSFVHEGALRTLVTCVPHPMCLLVPHCCRLFHAACNMATMLTSKWRFLSR